MREMFVKGMSTCGAKISEQLFADYKANGIGAMEISLNYDEYKDIDYKFLEEMSKKYDVKLWSFHLPFLPFAEIDISRPELVEYTVEYLSELIKKAAAVGIKIFVVHPSGEPIEDDERKERMDCAKESIAKLAEVAAKYDATIAVEDLPRTCLGRNSLEMLELISVDERVRVCFDTNHLLKESNVDFIRNLKGKIVTTHVSDYDFVDERHLLPGEGKTDWKELYTELVKSGYDGVWLYEVSPGTTKNIEREIPLTCKDFARNADAIFNGEL